MKNKEELLRWERKKRTTLDNLKYKLWSTLIAAAFPCWVIKRLRLLPSPRECLEAHPRLAPLLLLL